MTSIRLSSNPVENVYTIMTRERTHSFRCGIVLSLRDKIEMKESAANKEFAEMQSVRVRGTAAATEYNALLKKRLAALGISRRKVQKTHIKEFEKPTKKMLKPLKAAAAAFAKRIVTGAPVVVRFHNDCDGSSGAVGIFNAIHEMKKRHTIDETAVSWRMNKSIAYFEDSYHSDYAFVSTYSSVEKPLVFLSDFGTTPESEGAVDACIGKCEMIWIDHHPIYEGFPREKVANYISPWDHGGDSDYTAGYLSCLFAQLLCDVDNSLLMNASLISDHSMYADRGDKEAEKVALVLDYLTSRKGNSENLTPKYFSSLINDRDRLNETFVRASHLMNEAVELGLKKVRHIRTKAGIDVYALDFKHIATGEEFPLPGRYSSRLQEHLERLSGPKTMTIVHYGNYISIRAHRAVAERLSFHKLIGELQKETDGIYSFGGHGPALSIRSDKDHIEEVVELLLTAIGASDRD